MNGIATPDAYGTLIEPTTLKIQRLLPGPVERIWGYLTDSELRRKWHAAGAMEMKVGAPFELVWRNNELTDPPGKRPDGFATSTGCRAASPSWSLRKISFAGADTGDVSFGARSKGRKCATLSPHLPGQPTCCASDRAGMHLDVLVASDGQQIGPFWDGWLRLQKEYDAACRPEAGGAGANKIQTGGSS